MADLGIKVFQARIPMPLYKAVKKSADDAGVSVNYEVNRMLRWAVDTDKKGRAA